MTTEAKLAMAAPKMNVRMPSEVVMVWLGCFGRRCFVLRG